MDQKTYDQMRDYAWKYFSLHAAQRLTTFNFYVTISTLIIGAAVTLRKEHVAFRELLPLAVLLAFVSVIFWGLDQRNRQLVKNGEKALKYLDSLWGIGGHEAEVMKIIECDEFRCKHRIGWRYSTAFNAIFVVFFASGLILAVFCYLQPVAKDSRASVVNIP